MNIQSQSVRILGDKPSEEQTAWLDSNDLVFGYGACVNFYPTWHHVVIAYNEKEDRHALISMPSAKWEDSLKEGWVIVQRLSPEVKI